MTITWQELKKKEEDARRKLREEERRRWREQEAHEIEESKERMSVECGVPRSHPKFERVWDIAWSLGHSSGIYEVENYFRELADLLKP